MLEARCPKCGALFYGWALTEPEHQTCLECGTELEIYQADLSTQREKISPSGPEEQQASIIEKPRGREPGSEETSQSPRAPKFC
ncbi:hypothetical protein ES706_03923 [subsurface metagenome]|nr:hypothetical protein [Dehalococcoidia bacterium]